jgi:adenylate kinase
MNSRSRFLSSCFLAAALACSGVGTACAEHHYRVYDPYYSDYHVWNSGEVVYYQQWSRENHRDEHRDFRKLPPEEQKQYWTWRHSNGDHH